MDFDKDASFLAIKSFSINLGTPWGNEFAEKRMKDELTAALIAKGWTVAPDGQGDAEAVFHGAGEKKRDLNTFYSGGGYGYRRWGGGTATTTVDEYLVGTLVMDMFDSKSKNLIWRGIAQDELSDKAEKNAKKRAKAMEKLFKNFPPGSVQKK